MDLFYPFIPEIFLSFCILLQLLANSYIITLVSLNFPLIREESFWQSLFISVCLFFLFFNYKTKSFSLNLIFSNDLSINYIKILIFFSIFFLLFIIILGFQLQKLNFFEYFIIFLLSSLALLLLTSSSDILSVYLVLEMQALAFYILSNFKRDSTFSTEAGLKYFISGSFISCIFLFGSSLLYGILGTLNLNYIQLLLYFSLSKEFTYLYFLILLGILLITVIFLFKLSVFPFHFWSPDIYEGSPIASTAIFTILPKFSIVFFLFKWILIIYPFFLEISIFLLLLGFLSIFYSTFLAILQKRLKRLLIYSSISQSGFVVIALSQNNIESFVAVYFFIVIYIFTSILIWIHFFLLYSFQSKINIFYKTSLSSLYFSNLANLFQSNKLWAFSFVLIFFSIAGVPPLAGFFAKVLILFSIINSNGVIISLILVLLSSVSVFYYLKIIKTIFFDANNTILKRQDSQIIFYNSFLFFDSLIISFLLFLLLFFFFFPSFILIISLQIILGSFTF